MHMILVVGSTGVAQLLEKMNVVHFTMPMEPPQHGYLVSVSFGIKGQGPSRPSQLLSIQLPYKSWEESLVTPHTTRVISCQLHTLRLFGYIFTGGCEESQRNGGVLRVMEWHGVLHNAGWGKSLWMASTCKQHILVLWVLEDFEGVRNQLQLGQPDIWMYIWTQAVHFELDVHVKMENI